MVISQSVSFVLKSVTKSEVMKTMLAFNHGFGVFVFYGSNNGRIDKYIEREL